MADVTREDEKLLKLMREQDLITASQEARVRQALGKGQSLGEAVSRTPLVDSVKFASLQAYAARQSSEPVEKEEPGPPPFQPIQAEDDLEVALELDLDPPGHALPDLDYEVKDLGPVGAEEDAAPVESSVEDLDLDLDAGPAAPAAEEKPSAKQEFGDPRGGPAAPAAEEKPPQEPPSPPPSAAGPPHEAPAPPPPKPAPPPAAPPPEPAPEPVKRGPVRPPSVAELRRQALINRKPKAPEPAKAEMEGEVGSILEEAFTSAGGGKKAAPAAAAAKDGQAAGEDELPKPGPVNSYVPRAMRMQEFDLSDDEGISLIRQVNELLCESLDAGDGGVRLALGAGAGPNVMRFRANGRRRAAVEEEPAQVEKLVNRLKVMARLESWRRQQAQRGSFFVSWQGKRRRVLLDSAPGGSGAGETLTVHFVEG